MPAFVKDEESWSKAKGIVAKQYPDVKQGDEKYWKLVTHIYRNMRPGDFKKKAYNIGLPKP